MSLKTDLTYLFDKHKITKAEYQKLMNQLEGHDRSLRNKTIDEMKTRLDFEFGDAIGVPQAMKQFTKAVTHTVSLKMKTKPQRKGESRDDQNRSGKTPERPQES